jgi:hypothetical protein
VTSIVVGVDGSPSVLAALRFKHEEARLRARVRAVAAWHVLVAAHGGAWRR